MTGPGGRPAGLVAGGAAVVVGLAIVVLLAVRYGQDPKPKRSERVIRNVPEGIVSDCSKPVDAELNAWLATVPDGAIVNFRAGACYAQQARLVLDNRADLLIDGAGATFKSSAPNDNSKLVPNWFLLRSDRIVIRDMTIVGNFDDPGPPTPNRGSVTSNAGVGIFGGEDIEVSDMTIRHVFGDGVSVANAYYHDPENPTNEFSRNIRLKHLDISKAARHCVSPSQVTGFWLEDSKLDDCYLDAVDAEKDLITDPMSDLHFLRNTFSNYFGIGLVVPIGGAPGAPVDGVEIRDNRFPTLPFASVCNQAIALGGYENQVFSNVVVENNQIVSWKVAIAVQGVTSGRIRNNAITHPAQTRDGNTPPRPNDCGPDLEANVVLKSSPDVVVSDND
ncbi:MAG: hypothetical protein M3326_09945 [Actinomycetota bacterium]|nr:hypothetical protein [Actinomycetota bacterium]